jgi:hypothetical protein
VPYENGRALFDQAREVGLKSALITLPESGHVDWNDLAQSPYRGRVLKNFYLGLDLKNAQAPESCRP